MTEVTAPVTEKGAALIEVKGSGNPQELQESISICLMEGKCPVLSIEDREMSLEDIFIKLLEQQREEAEA